MSHLHSAQDYIQYFHYIKSICKFCKVHYKIKCHSLFVILYLQNAVQTCVLPFSSNVPLLFPAVKVLIDSKYFFCKRSVKFIPLDQACDGHDDCAGGEDELTCVTSFKVNTTFPGRSFFVSNFSSFLFFCNVCFQFNLILGSFQNRFVHLHTSLVLI